MMPVADHGPRLDARGVGTRIKGRYTLRDVSLTVGSGELVAIIGASGAGKTTLLDALAGIRPQTEGTVDRAGADRHTVGYVPQDDIIHTELPLARTLRYAARLRLPAGTSRSRIEDAVRDALDALGLAGRATQRVATLSGGERKRASIAVELLTRPRIFFLDEPTSGLDPATAADLMRLLRRLADDGATIVLTTHNPPDVARCDQVVVLADTGELAFAGSPADAREHFGADDIAQIYEKLADPPPAGPEALTDLIPKPRPEPSPTERSGTPPAEPARAEPARAEPARAEPARAEPGEGGGKAPSESLETGLGVQGPPIGAVGQVGLLARRNLEVLAGNRLTVAVLVGSPVMVLLMFVVLFKPNAFAFDHPSPSATVMILFWIAFGGFFFGLTYGLLQICTEFAILRRERFVGLRIVPYVLAKVVVLLPLLAAVDALMLAVLRGLGRLPAAGWGTYESLFGTLVVASAAALALGLLVSAAVAEPSQATIALPMLCFPQVLFVGAILPVPIMAATGRVISYAMSNRWAFEALGHGLGVARLWAHGRSPLGPPLLASYGDTFSRPVVADWAILAGLTVVFLAATCVTLRRRTR
jgi:ABC-type multidrug transport system ATPase subunit